MRKFWKLYVASALMGCSTLWAAGASAPAPGLQVFTCKDGTTVTAANAKGVCQSNKGLDAAVKPKPLAVSKTEPVAAAPAVPAKSDAAAGKEKPVAPGGGPGKVWANSSSKIYHCHGDRHYGTTKNGTYMSEADAKAQGMTAARKKACA